MAKTLISDPICQKKKKKKKKPPLLGVRQRPNYHPMQCPQKLRKPT